MMNRIKSCIECIYDKQKQISSDEEYLKEIKKIIDSRDENDKPPYLVYLFNQVYEKHFGKRPSFKEIKKQYNNLVLSMECDLKEKINSSNNPVSTAFMYARIGNYIDFGAMNNVDKDAFLSLFDKAEISKKDKGTLDSFIKQCSSAKNFLLLADNCGEIVLDKLFIEQLKNHFKNLNVTVMVRGGEASNDATVEDAEQAGLDKIADIITNGYPIAGTIYNLLPSISRKAFDDADVILSKGQGNYECLYGQGFHIFYSFLCKCDHFTNQFKVPKFTGIFTEEK